MESPSLVNQIKTAIAARDVTKMYELKDICDHIHAHGESYKSYGIADLPKDELYEEMIRAIKSVSDILTEDTDNHVIASERQQFRLVKFIPEMWMGSITKEPTISEIPDALILPKFDGCSCGVKLERMSTLETPFQLVQAVTRGVSEAYNVKKTDITDKFRDISELLLDAFNGPDVEDFQFESQPSRTLKEAHAIIVRGEIVLDDKGVTDSAPASVVAGKINGGPEVWADYVENLCFIPYEIMRICWSATDKHDIYVPTQIETVNFFTAIGLIDYPIKRTPLGIDSLNSVKEYFEQLKTSITQPLDGVVYCPFNWRYPKTFEETKPKQYGKLAWKPSSESTSTLREITYTYNRDGKINFVLTFDPVNINGKNYKNAKTAVSKLIELNGIGVGSPVTIKLAGDISPTIASFVPNPEIKPIKLPKKCPCCNTVLEIKKGKTPTLRCPNPLCREVLKQKMLNLISVLEIRGIAEGKLNRLPRVTLEAVDQAYLEGHVLRGILRKTSTRTLLVGLGIGGPQKVEKLLISLKLNPLESIKVNYDHIVDAFDEYIQSDPFAEEALGYIARTLEI